MKTKLLLTLAMLMSMSYAQASTIAPQQRPPAIPTALIELNAAQTAFQKQLATSFIGYATRHHYFNFINLPAIKTFIETTLADRTLNLSGVNLFSTLHLVDSMKNNPVFFKTVLISPQTLQTFLTSLQTQITNKLEGKKTSFTGPFEEPLTTTFMDYIQKFNFTKFIDIHTIFGLLQIVLTNPVLRNVPRQNLWMANNIMNLFINNPQYKTLTASPELLRTFLNGLFAQINQSLPKLLPSNGIIEPPNKGINQLK